MIEWTIVTEKNLVITQKSKKSDIKLLINKFYIKNTIIFTLQKLAIFLRYIYPSPHSMSTPLMLFINGKNIWLICVWRRRNFYLRIICV